MFCCIYSLSFPDCYQVYPLINSPQYLPAKNELCQKGSLSFIKFKFNFCRSLVFKLKSVYRNRNKSVYLNEYFVDTLIAIQRYLTYRVIYQCIDVGKFKYRCRKFHVIFRESLVIFLNPTIQMSFVAMKVLSPVRKTS